MIKENQRRHAAMHTPFDPITGQGSIGPRTEVHISGMPQPQMWLPDQMLADPFVRDLTDAGSITTYTLRHRGWTTDDVVQCFTRLRCQHDFAFWAASYVYIKCKGGGDDCLFRLTYPQRIFVNRLEQLRTAGRPIRIVLLKARQWGGSTTSQLYMAWLQLIHQTGLNSLIIAHQGTASDEIKDMFDRMIRQYPIHLLYDYGVKYNVNDKKMVAVGRSGATFRVPQRNCKIKIGTAERPNSCRGGDYNLVHLSEVGLWRTTDGKKPEDIVRAACAGVVYKPHTMIVYESTANGVGNFFHREYVDARDNERSQFRSLFISWYDIEQNQLPFASEAEMADFAEWLYANRESAVAPSNREESGQYLWWLWQKGATLEGINWYITERAKHSCHGSMAAECPSDDTEAFVNSGAAVFDKYKVEAFRPACRPPRYVGEVHAAADEGPDALTALHFVPDPQGSLWLWSLPDSAPAPSSLSPHPSPLPSHPSPLLPRPSSLPPSPSSLTPHPSPLLPRPSSLPPHPSPLPSHPSPLTPPYGGATVLGASAPSEGGEYISHRYLTVVDVGGRSYKADWSVIVVFDRLRMLDGGAPAVVAQWYGHCDMDILAWRAAQIAAFYDESLLVIESNTLETHDQDRMVDGDQSAFILNQIRRVYPNLYARRQSQEDIRLGMPRKYGFHTNVSTKPMVISTLIKAVREHLYTERDERCLNELLVYERKPNGAFGAISGEHDDLLMTRAIGLHICFYEMDPPRIVTPSASPVAFTPRRPLSAATL